MPPRTPSNRGLRRQTPASLPCRLPVEAQPTRRPCKQSNRVGVHTSEATTSASDGAPPTDDAPLPKARSATVYPALARRPRAHVELDIASARASLCRTTRRWQVWQVYHVVVVVAAAKTVHAASLPAHDAPPRADALSNTRPPTADDSKPTRTQHKGRPSMPDDIKVWPLGERVDRR